MRRIGSLASVLLLVLTARAGVQVYLEEDAGLAWLKYQCTAGEVVRAFALDVTVDQGRILAVSDFFVGESTAAAQGYGIFPASFRDHITVGPGGSIDWETGSYTPLASVADDPGGTLPGLNSSGVTLEFGGLWDPNDPAAVPAAQGTLCALQISEGATVTVAPNLSRGGVVSALPDMILAPVYGDAFVQPPEVTSVTLTNGQMSITFVGGELEWTTALDSAWTGTGDSSGHFSESFTDGPKKFYRVRAQ